MVQHAELMQENLGKSSVIVNWALKGDIVNFLMRGHHLLQELQVQGVFTNQVMHD